jgi:hypothetical protein
LEDAPVTLEEILALLLVCHLGLGPVAVIFAVIVLVIIIIRVVHIHAAD